MKEQQHHEMVLEVTHSSGADEWYCPTCGRRLVMKWEPKFERFVLEAGDEFATHSGSKGGLQMGSMQVSPAQNTASEGEEIDDPRLSPWVTWLDQVNFERLWNDEIS